MGWSAAFTPASETAGRNNVMDVWMMLKVLSPSVEHAEKPDLLFRASAATLLELAGDPKHLGADIATNRSAALRSRDHMQWGLCPAAQSRERPITLAVPGSGCDCDTNTSRSATPETGKQMFCLVRFLRNSNRARHPSPPEYGIG
jgi:hypothetical protein